MKKFITMLLVGLLVIGSFSAVFAEEPNTASEKSVLKENQGPKKLDLLKEFNAEIHQLNALRIERNQLQIQVIEKHDSLVDLILQARESKNKEALQSAQDTKQQLNTINDELKALHQDEKVANQNYKAALKSKDKEKAHAALQNLININTSINSKIKEKIDVLSSIVDILS